MYTQDWSKKIARITGLLNCVSSVIHLPSSLAAPESFFSREQSSCSSWDDGDDDDDGQAGRLPAIATSASIYVYICELPDRPPSEQEHQHQPHFISQMALAINAHTYIEITTTRPFSSSSQKTTRSRATIPTKWKTVSSESWIVFMRPRIWYIYHG